MLDVKMQMEGSAPYYEAHFTSDGRTRAKLLPGNIVPFVLPHDVLQSIRDLCLAYTPAAIKGTPQAYVNMVLEDGDRGLVVGECVNDEEVQSEETRNVQHTGRPRDFHVFCLFVEARSSRT